ncbi:MAG: TIGR03084 family protein [Limnohabitans sp.]|nr:TIGR03084 family protein [Limnohabitans sp.]
MKKLSADLLAESSELADFCERMDLSQWQWPTAFHGWSAWDEIAHLCLLDEAGTLAVIDAVAFVQRAEQLRARRAQGEEISGIARATYGHMTGPELLRHWRKVFDRLVHALAFRDAQARLPWFGPSMSARSFATARLMETWAHGLDIYDALHQTRHATPRLRHIAHLGVNTFAWTFQNRGLPVPEVAPYVALTAPDGSLWEWHSPSATDYVKGDAEDFCKVVTQRRLATQTQLTWAGSASAWLPIAQCFAGPPTQKRDATPLAT